MVSPMINKTHDGIPPTMYTKGKSNFMDNTGQHSKKQGAAARSNNSTSVASHGRTPITVLRGKGKPTMNPMAVLAARNM